VLAALTFALATGAATGAAAQLNTRPERKSFYVIKELSGKWQAAIANAFWHPTLKHLATFWTIKSGHLSNACWQVGLYLAPFLKAF
jgi:hypothetical protein